MNWPTSDVVQFLGRFHPLVVHVPIGLILVVGLIELLACRPRWKHTAAASRLILGVAVVGSIASAACGWMLAQAGGYDSALLRWHKWSGLGVAGGCLVTWLGHELEQKSIYRFCLGLTLLALALAGHWGGSLTHGRGYLARYAPPAFRAWLGTGQPGGGPPPADAKRLGFRDAVLPLLQRDCVACHGPGKAKGRLRLDSLAELRKGGGSGPVFEPGQGKASLLVQRLRLPLESEDHMPPEGKPQPTPEEIARIERWIDDGAREDQPGGPSASLGPSPERAAGASGL